MPDPRKKYQGDPGLTPGGHKSHFSSGPGVRAGLHGRSKKSKIWSDNGNAG